MADDAYELVRLRNNFYRDNYRRVLSFLLIMVIINLILCVVIGYLVTHRPTPQYFATSADGRITPLYPLTQPVVSKSELLQWATQAAVAAYTFDFVNYRKDLQAASEYFTPDGWQQFQEALKKTRILETVTSKKLVANAVATGAPVITDQSVINGRYAWKIRIPLLVTYESQSEKIPQSLEVNMIVMRVSTLETPKGIAIAQFIATERPLSNR
ncbi:MAG: type IVB secretion system apparatus protein IcmL/DotI [Gammaproteobacteria bacterium]